METIRRTIDSGWRLRVADDAAMEPALRLPPLPAEVPGAVHLDLQRAGVIPDPFVRLHERDVAWVDDTDWTYETTFALESVPDGDLYLRFLGLDTIAEIVLNGCVLGETDCMFVPHEFNVGAFVREGENTISVTFRSARRVGLERQAAWSAQHDSMPRDHFLWSARSFVRKAQYMFGWDWGPVLISCGIWRPVELLTVPTARLGDWAYDISFEDHRAMLHLRVDVERASHALDAPLELAVIIPEIGESSAEIPAGGELSPMSLTIPIDRPRRWSPDSPALYPLEFTLLSKGTSVDRRRARVGLRTVELVREPDADGAGEGFKFRVNGHDVFCKGANWIPADSFPSRSYDDPDRLRPLLQAAKDAGFNMLRVWGGGMYETDTFYDLCDALGLLVWQDFPFACAYYPDDPRTLEAIADEATAAVRRIRVHPSLALWCGNNENQQMYADDWHELKPPRFFGQAIYDDLLPRIVAEEDPTTRYWPGSAFGGPDPNSPDFGDRHNWNVWHGVGVEGGDWPHYAADRARFCSEFGFASSCGLAAWETVLAPADRQPASPAVQWHNKTGKPYDVYLGYIERHFPPVQSLDDLVYYSQLNQAEAMRFGVEHYRRLKGRCWGTLIWQLNDCWPVQSWSMIDYLGERKAVYYAARRFYAPVLLSLCRQGKVIEAHIVSDLLQPITGRLTVRVLTFDGIAVGESTEDVSLAPNSTDRVMTIKMGDWEADARDVFIHASLKREGVGAASEHGPRPLVAHPTDLPTSGDRQRVSAEVESILLLAEPKELRLPRAAVDVEVEESGDGLAVSLSAERFAAYVWLSVPGLDPMVWSDNFFHLLPGRPYVVTIRVPLGSTAAVVREKLHVRALNLT